MQYSDIRKAKFIKRPNRFIAHVLIDGEREIVHVKNTGRCREILKKGTTVILEKAKNKNRKTKYSVIAAYKNDNLINIDSQVPNQVVQEALDKENIPESQFKNITHLKREVTYNNSRFDIYFKNKEKENFIEIKGVTLEKNNIAMFPDAPTTRGTKHVKEMIEAVEEGYGGFIFFLIQMEKISSFTPYSEMDPEFDQAIKTAYEKGVNILAYNSYVKEDEIRLGKKIPMNIN